jgi:hypothetical protein
MSIEFIVWILAVIAALVFHLRKSARERQRLSARVATPEELDHARADTAEVADALTPEAQGAQVSTPPSPVTAEWGRREPSPPRRQTAAPTGQGIYWRRGDRLELAHAVVAMAVLGPCRAMAPYEQEEGNASAGARTRPAPRAVSRQP